MAIQASAASALRSNSTSAPVPSDAGANDTDHYNSFAMDELSRMLNVARTRDSNSPSGTSSSWSRPTVNTRTLSTSTFYGSGISTQPKIKRRGNGGINDTSSRTREWNNSSSISTSNHRRTAPRTTVNSIQRNKRTNELSGGYDRRANRNRDSEGSRSNLPVDHNINDIDHLLAMHLAEDLNGGIDLNDRYSHGRDFTSETVFHGWYLILCLLTIEHARTLSRSRFIAIYHTNTEISYIYHLRAPDF